jgi:hypothetical protein
MANERLLQIIKNWYDKVIENERAWLTIVEYARDFELSKGEIAESLLDSDLGFSDRFIKNETIRIYTSAQGRHSEDLLKAVQGKMSVRKFRESVYRKETNKPVRRSVG